MSIIKNATTRLSRLALAAGAATVLGFAPGVFADETVALKNALYGAGYNITNVNSGMDDTTRAELTRFQQDNGLQASGMLNEPTKEALGMVSVQVAASGSVQTPEANQAAAKEPEAAEDEAIEEEDDGGWSFF